MLTTKLRTARLEKGDLEAFLASGLRKADQLEAFRLTGLHHEQAVRMSVKGSDLTGKVVAQGKTIAIFGLAISRVPYVGSPWLVANDAFENKAYALSLARKSKIFIDRWSKEIGRLENFVDPEHYKSIRYLEWLGFNFDYSVAKYGPYGHRLLKFWR